MAITLNDNLQINAPKHIDAKYITFISGVAQPWPSAAAAVAGINSAYRYQYLTVLCLMNSDPVEYWWRAGTADAQLETKNRESYGFTGTTAAISLISPYYYDRIVVLPTSNLTNLQIGTTLGGTDIEPSAAVTSTIGYSAGVSLYTYASTTLYFTNIVNSTKIILYKTF